MLPELSTAPTVMTFSASPGITIDEAAGPEFPAATHITSPFSTILLQASSNREVPSEGLSPPTGKGYDPNFVTLFILQTPVQCIEGIR